MNEPTSVPVPVRPRSLLALGLLGVLLPGALAVFATLTADSVLRERIADTRLRFARTVAAQLEFQFRLAVDGVAVSARRMDVQDALRRGDETAARRALQSAFDSPPLLDALLLVDSAGRPLGPIPADSIERLAPWIDGPQPTAREWRLLESHEHLIVREPVFDPAGRQIGTLLASVAVGALLDNVGLARFGDTGHATVVHRDGSVLATSDPVRRGQRLRAPEVIDELRRGGDGVLEYRSLLNERDEFSAIAHLERWPMAVLISQARAEANQPIAVAQRGILQAIALLAVVALLIAWLGSRVFLVYERRLQSAHARIATQAAATAESLALRQAILDSANNAIIVVDTEGLIRSVNPTTERWLGWTSEEMIGRMTPFDLHPPAQIATVRSRLALETGIAESDLRYADFVRRAREGEPIEVDRDFLRKDGSLLPVHLSITALRLSDGTLDGYLAVATDVSERRRAERALRESEARFRTLYESAPLGIYLIDVHGKVQLVNAYSARLHGRSVERLNAEGWGQAVHPEDRQAVLDAFGAAFAARVPFEMEYRVVHLDGTLFNVHTLAVPLFDEDGRFAGYIGNILDISARKRIEQLKSEFIATVSHELRTPLTSIRGSLGLLVGGVAGELPSQAEQLVRIAHSNSERLVRLINDILDIERIEAGKMDFRLEVLDLAQVVESAVHANRGFADHHGVTYAFRDRPRGVKVFADRDRLMQALTNLMGNAAKFAPKGSLVELGVREIGEHVRVTVTDHGRGIPEAFRNRIFGKFAQADASDTREKGGSGLGLSITKAIVEGLGGRIGFDSEPGDTTFWFELPRHAAAAPSASVTARRVLVIEDDPDIAQLIAAMVRETGCDADVAHDAASAKRLLDAQRYAAATVDILLPDQDGLALVRELRAHPAHADLPLIVVSATADVRRRQTAAGMLPVLDWLNKPIDRERLLADVRHAVRLRGGRRPRVLHVEDDADLVEVVARLLGPEVEMLAATDLATARAVLGRERLALVLLDLGLPDGSGLDLLPDLQRLQPLCPVVIFSAQDVDREVAGRVASVLAKADVTDARFVSTVRNLMADAGGDDGR